ncbi:ComF family protein [Segetibacter koreensis]|uniref:ComF family protein n=1 Tax=Segetibacter koreensis TaxID=398037 RepID=UPI0004769F7C|nr:phosphoribosyltransferase family protein [Segetibacter koreensis]
MLNLKSSIPDFVHLFFPHVCIGCGTDILDDQHQLCLRCLSDLPVTNFFSQPNNPVEKKFYGRMPVKNGGAGYFFTKDSLLETLIYELKYKGNKDIGIYLGQILAKFLTASSRFDEVDVLVPLPLNPKREKKRGYNQASAICTGISSAWKKPVIDKAVIRKVYTETQTQRGRVTRWENMEGVFAISDSSAIKNKHILLVDDVITTGASLEACGSEILKVAGTTLSIATLAATV